MCYLWCRKTLERVTMWTLPKQNTLLSRYLDKNYGEGTSNELFLKSQTLGKFTTNEIEEMIKKYKNLLDQLD